ncbi:MULTISPECIES: glycoside hydrolase family 2 protein [unclassified Arenibacter]|uniref:glycoside hydrolase family 2 protein n=1 Tax=unclassified Arenibacter TaxID=2615047 RepID=UPI000E3565F6|nr:MULTISPECIES: sugar-binding domain-containing protein [unclassified Arenibacter]MCM4165988.1 hypothetical protein [Arenibacter sp. A80]RFT54375.1 hypothetical protein D0S24_20500 [Arenibacter sp. P308M17]
MDRITLWLFLFLNIFSVSTAQSLLLSGKDWEIQDIPIDDGQGVFCNDWIPATVPGNIQGDLEASRYLKPLWYGMGDPRLPDVAFRDWWYRKDFMVPVEFIGQRMTLTFDGVDIECEVWVNGQRLGGNSGMFKRFSFDATNAVLPGQINRIEVRIAGMPKELHDLFYAADDPGGLGNTKVNNAVRKQLKELKSKTNGGYDWAVAIYTMGIWKDVWLKATGSINTEQIGVLSSMNSNYTKADLRILLDVDSWSEMPVKVSVRARCEDSKADTAIISQVTKGKNHLEIPLSISKPLLWWPMGHGKQPLYDLVVEISHPENGTVMESQSTRFGVREISWQQVPGVAADFYNPMKLVVNGRPIRQMGSNLLPPDALFGRMNEPGLRLLEQARDAGINCLRLWGGGVILTDSMYNRADELGIMLMQEFPLANSDPETDSVFLSNLKETAVNIIKQIRNHPSIVEWTGGNEMPTFTLGSDHPALLILGDAVKEHDNRFLRATEADEGSGPHGPYVYHTKPDSHMSWLGAGEQNLYQRFNTRDEMRLSEFGTNSPANLEVWQRTIPPLSQWPLSNYEDPVLIRKNVFWGALIKENWLHKEITEDLFGPLDGLEQLVPAGQFLAAEGLRYAMDALRRKGDALGGGFMSWNYNEPWPNGAGSYMVDYDGRPLMNYYFTKQALSKVSLNLKYDSLLFDPAEGVNAEIFLVSDAPEAVENVKWHWLARDIGGKVIGQKEGTASIDPIEVKSLGQINIVPPMELGLGPIIIEMQLFDSNENLLTERVHIFGSDRIAAPLAGLLKNQTDYNNKNPGTTRFKALNGLGNLSIGTDSIDTDRLWLPLSRTSLQAKVMPLRTENDQEILEIIITNSGSMTALFCEPHPIANYRTDIMIDNNYCFIPPGESRSIIIRSLKKSFNPLNLAQTGWKITSWNANPLIIKPTIDVLFSLGRQDSMCREFGGYTGLNTSESTNNISLKGQLIDPKRVHYLMDGNNILEIEFDGTSTLRDKIGLININSSDQSSIGAKIRIELNGEHFDSELKEGYGFQKEDPSQLAQAKTVGIIIPEGIIKPKRNVLKIQVLGNGWFTWDSLDLRICKK